MLDAMHAGASISERMLPPLSASPVQYMRQGPTELLLPLGQGRLQLHLGYVVLACQKAPHSCLHDCRSKCLQQDGCVIVGGHRVAFARQQSEH